MPINKYINHLKSPFNEWNYQMTSLHAAAHSGDLIRVRSLVNRGVNIDSQTNDRNTALHRAVMAQKEDIVRFLIDNGANCNIPNNDGQTSLHLAAQVDNVLILLLLLEGHAEVNPRVSFHQMMFIFRLLNVFLSNTSCFIH